MKMNRTSLVLGLALVVGALIWLKVHDGQVRQVAGLEQARDSLNRALGEARQREKTRQARDSTLATEIGALRARLAHSQKVDTLVLKIPTLDSALAARLPDSLKAAVLAVTAPRDSLIAALRSSVADLEGIVARDAERLSLRDTSLAECQAGLREALKQRDIWRRQATPSLFIRAHRALPLLILGGAIGYVVH